MPKRVAATVRSGRKSTRSTAPVQAPPDLISPPTSPPSAPPGQAEVRAVTLTLALDGPAVVEKLRVIREAMGKRFGPEQIASSDYAVGALIMETDPLRLHVAPSADPSTPPDAPERPALPSLAIVRERIALLSKGLKEIAAAFPDNSNAVAAFALEGAGREARDITEIRHLPLHLGRATVHVADVLESAVAIVRGETARLDGLPIEGAHLCGPQFMAPVAHVCAETLDFSLLKPQEPASPAAGEGGKSNG